MIRRMLARLLRVAPPGWAISTLSCSTCSAKDRSGTSQWKIGLVDIPNRFGPKILGCGGFLLGAYRAIAFHPYFRPGYLRWLKGTPWTVNKPLPLGPWNWFPRTAWHSACSCLWERPCPILRSLFIINLFLFAHILVLILTFWKTGASVHGYCALSFLGFVPQWWRRHVGRLCDPGGCLSGRARRSWHALRKFPVAERGFLRDFGLVNVPAATDPNPSCGWSFDRFYRDIRLAKGSIAIDALSCACWEAGGSFAVSLIVDRGNGLWCRDVSFQTIFVSAGVRPARLRPGMPASRFILGENPDVSVDHSGV